MSDTLTTTLHVYHFDISTPEGRADYDALRGRLEARGLECFESWGGKGHYSPFKDKAGAIELETRYLFDNQWNTACGLRVFDWAQDATGAGLLPRHIKRGHYLEQTDAMRAARRDTVACGYCGKQRPALDAPAFCPCCVGSEYLKRDDLHLLRLKRIDDKTARAPLSDQEAAELMLVWVAAQTTLNAKKAEAARAKVLADYDKSVRLAELEKAGFLWLLDNGIATDNWIFYRHTASFCLGWRAPIEKEVYTQLCLDLVGFPVDYEIRCAGAATVKCEGAGL